MKRKAREVTSEICQEFRERRNRLRDDYEDAACESEALRCLECGFKRGSHAPDCEAGRERPGQILVSRALVNKKKPRFIAVCAAKKRQALIIIRLPRRFAYLRTPG